MTNNEKTKILDILKQHIIISEYNIIADNLSPSMSKEEGDLIRRWMKGEDNE